MRAVLIAVVLSVGACAKFNASREGVQPPPRVVNPVNSQKPLTFLNTFYGSYETIDQNGEPVKRLVSGPWNQQMSCDTLTQIGNANIERDYQTRRADGKKEETILMDSYDPETKKLIPADEVWISPGAIKIPPSGYEACTDYTMSVFADRGVWTQDISGELTYRFNGQVLKKSLFDGKFTVLELDEALDIRPAPNGTVLVKMHVTASDGNFSGSWVLRKNE